MLKKKEFEKLLDLSRLSNDPSSDLSQDFNETIGYIEETLALYQQAPLQKLKVPETVIKKDLLTELARADDGEKAKKSSLSLADLEKMAKENKAPNETTRWKADYFIVPGVIDSE